jgi:hypothetical protein
VSFARLRWWVAVVALLALAAGPAAAQTARTNPLLTALHQQFAALRARSPLAAFVPGDPLVRVLDERVVIDAVADGDVVALQSALAALGMQNIAVSGRFVSGELPLAAIPALEHIVGLRFAQPSAALLNAGSVTSQGDPAMRSNVARATYGVTGAGIKVGALSDSFNCKAGAAGGVSSGDLSPVQVIQEISSCTSANDEGRAMLEIVHDVAPGASLAFASAFNGLASFANNILALHQAGAKVIVDDVIYLTESMFQDGPIAQAVDTVVAAGAAYFSSAGNAARRGYESVFRPGSVFAQGAFPSAAGAPAFRGGTAHNFAPSGPADHLQSVTVPSGGQLLVSFQWDSPFFSVSGAPGSPNDVDIYVLNAGGTQVVGGSTANNIGGDAVEFFSLTNSGFGPVSVNIMIVARSGPLPGFIKYVSFRHTTTINEYNTASGTLYGHANAAGAAAVGAASFAQTPAFGVNPPVLEVFSSAGPTRILFDTDGAPLATPLIRPKPEMVAPDGGNTTFFFQDTGVDSDFTPNFFGTSAAAPHAAAVAALLLEQRPTLAPFAIYSIMQGTAIDMGPAGFDSDSGFGLVQADAALRCVATAVGQARDVDGNCKGDVLWRRDDGLVYVWFMEGATISSAEAVTGVPAEWAVQRVGDFDGDGRADVLWRRDDGLVYVWFMDGATISSAEAVTGVPLDWSIQGAGDFNGDGKADIVWRHAGGLVYVWLMDGSTIASHASPAGVANDWTILGVGDFDGDGRADVLWRHTSNSVHVWFMNGAAIGSAATVGTVTAGWVFQGTGDFNADGKADILWRDAAGAPQIWLMNGGVVGTGSVASNEVGWVIEGISDFNGDGKADILWRNPTTGEVKIWFMNGTALASSVSVTTVGPEWDIQ